MIFKMLMYRTATYLNIVSTILAIFVKNSMIKLTVVHRKADLPHRFYFILNPTEGATDVSILSFLFVLYFSVYK